jgi:membrane protease YdiL (CAAX protease family)
MPISSVIFQIIIILLVPALSIANLKMIDKIKELALPDKKKLYFQSATNQIVLTVISLWAAHHSDISLNYVGNISNLSILCGVVFLVTGFTLSYFTTKDENINEKNPGLELLKPNTSSEKISWVLVNVVAAICEEIIFRGVLFYIFMQTTQSPVAAAILSGIVFGFSHSVQGVLGIVMTTVFGIGLQYIVYLNDGLLIAMIVHFLYNMGTTYLILRNKKSVDDENQQNLL